MDKICLKTIEVLSIDELAFRVVHESDSDHEQLVDLIKEIDKLVEDWDFTNSLYEHFNALHKQYLEEVAEEDNAWK